MGIERLEPTITKYFTEERDKFSPDKLIKTTWQGFKVLVRKDSSDKEISHVLDKFTMRAIKSFSEFNVVPEKALSDYHFVLRCAGLSEDATLDTLKKKFRELDDSIADIEEDFAKLNIWGKIWAVFCTNVLTDLSELRNLKHSLDEAIMLKGLFLK